MVGEYGRRGSTKSKCSPLFLSIFRPAQLTNTLEKISQHISHVLIYYQFQLHMNFFQLSFEFQIHKTDE